ncbi:serine/threonine-protein kinase-like protein DCLK1 [Cucurbitaria berberidis CBS 394.84]|uniref:Serine/threonine-protein kinase-like protein DCLK1 n=1 Tax=Cucurbitaria berberidis CBS 394.84 TaxID=1168544 RepID=A0A9P4LA26_9PLEO|nr:serine/threonine-protein kinase-like protein DCLK1 [Cucurbitaria berberidis CBS 394.84]KAF1846968.1 serine/threonine-protein kinase-like protein DCLK1 [Cucurbitaria berberidis CBS 394.84]
MAPTSSKSSHTFQKLKLDTSAPHKPFASSFASIPRKESLENGHAQSQLTAQLAGVEPQNIPDGTTTKCNQNGGNGPTGSYDGSVASSRSEGEDIELQFKRRTMSISFNKEVSLEDGKRLGLEVPIPKPPRQSHSQPSESGSYSDQEYLEMTYGARRHFQHRVGESRYPLLQTTVDDLAKDPEYSDQVASLTSETTASPPLDEAQTPLETPSEYMLSPLPATSPIEFPLFSPRRSGPPRTKSYRSEVGEDGGLRRVSRRSSGRSGRSLSSMSPAASFLARFKASEAPIKPSEPDDEGQGIGYDSEYIIGKQIGYGGFSIVKEVTSMEDGKPVVNAVKIVRKLQTEKSELENEQIQTQFDHEVEIWRFLRHPYILPLLRVYTTDFATFCITKLNKGGTLFDLVRDTRRLKKTGLPEHIVKRYTYQLASAMRYLHNDVQVVHRDIKLENVLLDMTVPNAERDGGDVLLCDFGMADFIISDQRDGPEPHSIGVNQNIGPADTSTSVAGSLQYAAPELFNAASPLFSPAADIWSFGVVLFALLTATLPFNDGLDIKTTEKIQKGEWNEELVRSAEAVQEGSVDDVLAVVRGCLELDVSKRWNVHDILECAWLRDCEQHYENVSRAWLAS